MSDTQTPPVAGTFCWQECMTRDAAAAKAFYTQLFGWTTSEMPMPSDDGEGVYTMFHPADGAPAFGGMVEMNGEQFEGVPPHWLTYVAVDDVNVASEKAASLGGTIMVPPTAIPEYGAFCIIQDPTGAVLALFQPAAGGC